MGKKGGGKTWARPLLILAASLLWFLPTTIPPEIASPKWFALRMLPAAYYNDAHNE